MDPSEGEITMKHEVTFAMIKPGAVHRGLIGDIIRRFEYRGLSIIGMKFIQVTEEQACEHYKEHEGKSFYPRLISYIQSGPVVVLAIYGENAITLVRKMAGATNPLEAIPGTIRGDYSADIENNIIHTSDAKETATRELSIYFSADEILDYQRVTNAWSFEYEQA